MVDVPCINTCVRVEKKYDKFVELVEKKKCNKFLIFMRVWNAVAEMA